uniref:Uncharacterized protein n=1 Tax=Anopheles quadriannulatus TaxID=34691 RepID=A0A182XSV8_ANOQN
MEILILRSSMPTIRLALGKLPSRKRTATKLITSTRTQQGYTL